nr:MAG TPA: hypothetical protein [Caudoviricetes sp.]
MKLLYRLKQEKPVFNWLFICFLLGEISTLNQKNYSIVCAS